MQILPGRKFFRDRSNAAYQVLTHYPDGLMLDVGAAAGYTATMMIRASPNSRVIAFEPFPNNHRYFRETVGGDPRITLDTRAVSDKAGAATFNVPAVVGGSEAGWETMAGYSSLGGLGAKRSGQISIEVETCRLDAVVNEPVRFLKIDTQGAELRVLRGAERLIDREMIDILVVEFDGSEDVMNFLIEKRFHVLDSECVLILSAGEHPQNWTRIRDSSLSTGQKTVIAWPRDHISHPHNYCRFLRDERKRLGAVWTDLVCVSQKAMPDFMFAAGRRDAETPSNYEVSMRGKINMPFGPKR
ncbi:FkbM family methyltransferase [Mesorhizobium sp. DCY119]|uniref:FkbM family methyltransferase n=1 Tax=Mesorhizobium sp. DCY119 TaxID=2108445 RepID=UPI0014027792|nr:FkbM family methyltransferase [Mesorhizobium sp. DCY119]